MGEIGSMRIAVFIGQDPRFYFYDASEKVDLLRK